MNEDFMQYVYSRIEKVLKEDKEYMELQSKCVEAQKNKDLELERDISNQMDAHSEVLCYIRGFNDASAVFNNSTK